ncbi:MAG: TetR/AcrR family transcriptional regulator [Thalassolituus maritimus]|uniref:Transcriptional regulator, TetR family n=1 Tax=Thalassolituus maritimus TaxID=484498 RepID=A0A1N7PND9_9GAMM|nr:TetR/AcrR family transcriptional regulator [Thalassolituus maritimus]TPD54924.1 MAG: TetR/AcrR family transcriptional regulator [Thalassolituus maritimus]SIT12144.1 transcriptional regulator, TetR family [Thalassolituus maritimus]
MTGSTHSKPRRRPSQARSQDTVNCILEATAHILRSEGFRKATTNHIAERAGVSIGSLYQYFPNKQALLRALTEKHLSEMQQQIAVRLSDSLSMPVPEAIASRVDVMLDAHALDPALHAVLTEHASQILPREEQNRLENLYTDLVLGYLNQRSAEICCDDLKLASFILVHSLETLTHRAIASTDPQQNEWISKASLRRHLIRLFTNYLSGQ